MHCCAVFCPQGIWALGSAPQGADTLLAADSGSMLPTLAALLRHQELPARVYACGALAAICQNTLQVGIALPALAC
jgi:hypothetical protein